MKIKEKLNFLISVFNRRQIGNTTLIKKGIDNYDRPFGVVSHNLSFSKEVIGESKFGNPLTITRTGSIVGSKTPVIIDHHLLHSIASESLEQIQNLEERVEKSSKFMNSVMVMSERYQKRCHNIEDIALELWLCPWWNFPLKRKLVEKAKAHFKEVHDDPYWDHLGMTGIINE
jgi:AAA+ ATPase superfamily predicted ATPase